MQQPTGNTDWEQQLWSERGPRSNGVFAALGVLFMVAGVVLVALGAKAAVSLLLIGVPLTIYGAKLIRRDRLASRRPAEISGAFVKKPHRGESSWTHRGGASFGSRDQTA
jgi:uncharacterized membrane protein HdeD (DUF308 family)